MISADLIPTADVPEEVRDFLLRVGGSNPYGLTAYRLVIAEMRMRLEAGEFTDWRDNTSVQERGGSTSEVIDGVVTRKLSKERPLRVVTEIRPVRVYSDLQGWIVERWFPASMYGTRAEWEQVKLRDGTPVLGPYPEQGEYELVAGPVAEMPNTSELRETIERIEYTISTRAGTARERFLKMRDQARRREEQREAKKRRESFERVREATWYMRSPSLEAARHREALADDIRARGGTIGHVGS